MAARVESAGFHTLLAPDHAVGDMPAPMTTLVLAAEATSRLRVGTLVLNNDFRHPALVAREAATIDRLTDGRYELGLGAGNLQHEYDEIGLPFDPPAVRAARLEESARVVRALLAGQTLDFDGAYYRVAGHRCADRPVQDHVPLLIGGNGRQVLAVAARTADIIGFTGFSHRGGGRSAQLSRFTDAGLRDQIEWVRSAEPSRFDALELSTLVQRVVITGNVRGAVADLQAEAPGLTAEDIVSSPYLLVGSAAHIVDQLRDRRERLGVSYITVFEPDFEAMTSIIERLS